MTPSWIRKFIARPVTCPIRKGRPRARLGVQLLEDRLAPAGGVTGRGTGWVARFGLLALIRGGAGFRPARCRPERGGRGRATTCRGRGPAPSSRAGAGRAIAGG